jgi:hypothetical protein
MTKTMRDRLMVISTMEVTLIGWKTSSRLCKLLILQHQWKGFFSIKWWTKIYKGKNAMMFYIVTLNLNSSSLYVGEFFENI